MPGTTRDAKGSKCSEEARTDSRIFSSSASTCSYTGLAQYAGLI